MLRNLQRKAIKSQKSSVPSSLWVAGLAAALVAIAGIYVGRKK